LASDFWNASAAPWKLVMMPRGRPISASAWRIAVTAAAKRGAGREVEGDGGGGKLAEDADRQHAAGWARRSCSTG